MFTLFVDVLVMSGLLWVLAELLPGVRVKTFGTAITVALVYGLLNYLLFWLLAMIAFIPMLLTMGMLCLVINTFLLWLTDRLIEDFEISSLGMTFLMALLLTAGKVLLGVLL